MTWLLFVLLLFFGMLGTVLLRIGIKLEKETFLGFLLQIVGLMFLYLVMCALVGCPIC